MKLTHRIKYYVVKDGKGEWQRTGLMAKNVAEQMAEHLRKHHERVEAYRDEFE